MEHLLRARPECACDRTAICAMRHQPTDYHKFQDVIAAVAAVKVSTVASEGQQLKGNRETKERKKERKTERKTERKREREIAKGFQRTVKVIGCISFRQARILYFGGHL